MATRGVRVAACVTALGLVAAPAANSASIALSAAFGRAAALGAPSPLRIGLRVDAVRLRPPVTGLRLLLPAGLDLTSSGLGLATCRVPALDFETVIFYGPLPDCPANAIVGRGTARAAIWLDEEEHIGATGAVTLVSGPERAGSPGVIALVVAQHPVRAQLAYAGSLFEARGRFGIGIEVALPPIPNPPLGATVGLADMQLTIGGRDLRYVRRHRGRKVSYRPDGLALPLRCPRAGFPFRAELRFADGSQRATEARAACPHG